MPAMVSSVMVRPGDVVSAGQGLVILEAMKMENEIKAQSDGIVEKVLVEKGKSVEKGELMVVLEQKRDTERR
jgi:pyruvate carboxylase subunit B